MSSLKMWIVLCVISLSRGLPSNAQDHQTGQFFGVLKLQPLSDGLHMKVLEPFTYTDGSGHTLGAATGFITDGASIPRPLWTLVGSPFTGKYVSAAVIHDVGCVDRKYSWQSTHRMFYDAMIDSGVSEHLAKVLYFGVRLGGPRWNSVKLAANTKEELDAKIAASGALIIEKTSGTTPEQKHSANVVIAVHSPGITDSDIRTFDEELTVSERMGQPLSVQDIESKTAGR